jgi:hypothetical protein
LRFISRKIGTADQTTKKRRARRRPEEIGSALIIVSATPDQPTEKCGTEKWRFIFLSYIFLSGGGNDDQRHRFETFLRILRVFAVPIQPSAGFAPTPNQRRFAVTATRLSVASRFSAHRANRTKGSPIKK